MKMELCNHRISSNQRKGWNKLYLLAIKLLLLQRVLWWTFKETSLVLKADFEIDFLTWVRRLCGNAARLKAIKIGNMQKWMAQLDISGDFISEWSNVPFELAFLVKGNRGTAVAAAPAPAWYRCGSNELLDSYVQVVEKDDFSIE